MDLAGFIDTYRDAIAQRVVESYPPLYRPSENGGKLPMLLRSPLGAQADAIRGAALSLEAHRGTTVVGEMGTGKTFIAASAAHMAGFKRILVICPPHLTRKWKREIEQTVPGARAAIVASITDLERLRLSIGSGPLFAVMSREGPSSPTAGPPPSLSGGPRPGAGSSGTRRRESPSRSPAARSARRKSWTRTGSPDGRGPVPQEARLRPLRLSPLASRQLRA